MNVRHVFAAILACLPFLAFAEQPVRFAEGAEITLPTDYLYSFEDGNMTIVVSPKQHELFRFRLTFHSLARYLAQRPRIAEEFVASMAEKEGRRLLPIQGTNHKWFFEPGTPSNISGEAARNMHGVVAMREGYTTMTLTVPERYSNEPIVRDFVGGGMEALLSTLRYVDN
jgi:hypothetical protein